MCLNDLYIINYGDGYGQCKAPLMEKNDKRPFLIKENCNISESIKKDLYNLNTKLNERNKELNKNYKVGVISRGTHSNDYAEFYGIDMEGDKWKDNKVMFVFECPGGNIDASFLNDENTEDYCEVNRKNAVGKVTDVIDMEQYKLHMAKVLWHADPKFVSEDGKEELSKEDYINSYEDFSFFGKYKNYSELMLSIIKTFKLRNFYTTNMFRYEIFEEKDGLDSAKNLVEISGILEDEKLLITNTFKKELEVFKPKAIITTSNPAYYIKQAIKNGKIKLEKNVNIITVPHPAARISKKNRFLRNAIDIIKGLMNATVINEEDAKVYLETAFERYCDIHDD